MSRFILLALFALFAVPQIFAVSKGIIELDELSWDRIVDGSKPVLVSFQEFGWKDPKDYQKVSEEFKSAGVIVAKVDTSKSEELKKQFSISSYPTFLFFSKGETSNPVSFTGGEDSNGLIEFVRQQQSPALKQLKEWAKEYVSTPTKRDSVLKQAEAAVTSLADSDKEYGSLYTASMKKIKEKGDDFVTKETERLQGLIDSKSTVEKKKTEFTRRLNVLKAFIVQSDDKKEL